MFNNCWYKITIIQNDDILYLHYRHSKGFYWGEDTFATLFLKKHIEFDNKLIVYLSNFQYKLEECTEFYSYHSYMKYHGKTY